MLLNLEEKYKQHLTFFVKQTEQDLQEVCKLILEFFLKRDNKQMYITIAQKLDVEQEIIKNAIDNLVNLLLECFKNKIKMEELRKMLLIFGFNDKHAELLVEFYRDTKIVIEKYLSNADIKLPEYHNLDWRFEIQVDSKTVSEQAVPIVSIDLDLVTENKTNETENFILQTDSNNIYNLVHQLEIAMQESRLQHVRTISHKIK